MKKLFSSFCLLFLLISCSNDADYSEKTSVSNKADYSEKTSVSKDFKKEFDQSIAHLKDIIDQNQKQIKVLENRIASNNLILTKQFDVEVSQLRKLVNHIPGLEHKYGYIKEINQENLSMYIEFVNKKADNKAPNGFEIEMKESKRVSVSSNADFYVLNSNDLIKISEAEELQNKVNEHNRLFNLYFVNKKLILASEQYLP
ncbi:hypothetical protein [Pontibacillus sp. HMF3514]|uniref:hypothetical protein n=1 Tax=Pontibacillus sp. HMF3514 TaxID=2692425 RepID=UPI0013203533|nr:hypothetical protein [Pontibacillus sp. HMF3514]QHE50868.1 hypothetical protein GS400_01895 [Pontibacillus sp. HMF3514]